MERDYKKDYEEFWKDIVENPDGTLNKDHIMRELSDFKICLENVPSVYSEVTGGTLSYPTYQAKSVIDLFNEKYGNKACNVDYLFDDWDDITKECQSNNDYKKVIFTYLGVEN